MVEDPRKWSYTVIFEEEEMMLNRWKCLPSIILILLISFSAASCISSDELKRDLSTPATRLIGHWGISGDGNLVASEEYAFEWWFGELNEDGIGSWTRFINGSLTTSGEDRYSSWIYEVLSESGDKVTIGFSMESVGIPDPLPDGLMKRFEVTKDGRLLRSDDSKRDFQYIDSRTKP